MSQPFCPYLTETFLHSHLDLFLNSFLRESRAGRPRTTPGPSQPPAAPRVTLGSLLNVHHTECPPPLQPPALGRCPPLHLLMLPVIGRTSCQRLALLTSCKHPALHVTCVGLDWLIGESPLIHLAWREDTNVHE